MNSLQRIQAVLRGEIPDRLPVLPQSFMFAAQMDGYSIGQINRKPDIMAKCHLNSRERFGYDGCIIDVDDASLAEACGASVVYREDNVAVVKDSEPVLRDLREIDGLSLPDPLRDGRLPEWLEVTERIAEKAGDECFIIGRADQGPFNLLCLLRGAQQFMEDLITEDEEVILHALAWTTKAHVRFAKAQLEAGAHAASMGDAYASPNLISPIAYRKFASPWEKMAVDEVQSREHPYAIHICGDTTGIIKEMGDTGARILEVDWKVDMGKARALVPENTVLMGNINPSDPMYLGTPVQVEAQVKKIIEATRGRGIIVSSGCALGANTKPENVTAMVEAVRKYGSREYLEILQTE
ncbi:uroporphyrinogen decarboxylase family protein [Lactonifactor longoviformis]|uniref:Uroporphyrinogen decarboxylase n=1 Tax=Lactonifactor longoviformis DSM 17459 TaxID=1122155 RepID=A0A1M4Y189_9CLOT|nr:uroporphyrinogen decarboxylase family protein [Lactonifactor longoviformis]SHE99597.1 uroporphyrinogen decarboxylase [Lactonifactor longoviformis DSM 17459]